jgi:hypothetical protein
MYLAHAAFKSAILQKVLRYFQCRRKRRKRLAPLGFAFSLTGL